MWQQRQYGEKQRRMAISGISERAVLMKHKQQRSAQYHVVTTHVGGGEAAVIL